MTVAESLARIRVSRLNAFTDVLEDRATAQAENAAGPLAGVPFAAKNLFDIAGLPTLAGAKVHARRPVATLLTRIAS